VSGVLLDTHSLLWWDNALAMSPNSIRAIQQAQSADSLYISPITAWEIGAADRKPSSRPPLRGLPPETWLQLAMDACGAKLAPLTQAIALETARVPSIYGSGDPGDCFLLATAHIENLTLITRDGHILKFAKKHLDYLSVIAC
jgi:PIN domain nuclease of toxin-antitoxin system